MVRSLAVHLGAVAHHDPDGLAKAIAVLINEDGPLLGHDGDIGVLEHVGAVLSVALVVGRHQ
eukprot:27775-Rhodomonas_salina.1